MNPNNRVGAGAAPSFSVDEYLAMGSPKLALARALGIKLTPWVPIVAAEFPDTSTTLIPNVGFSAQPNKITQDMVCDGISINLLNEATANESSLSTMSDYYYNVQSGIDATMEVTGQPGYPVFPDFTPLAVISDMIGLGAYPKGWILTNQQGIKMSFNARIPLPVAPYRVVVAFRLWGPNWELLTSITTPDAIRMLRDCGYTVSDSYEQCACNKLRL